MNTILQNKISSIAGALVLLVGIAYLVVDLIIYKESGELNMHWLHYGIIFSLGIVLLRAKDSWFTAIGVWLGRKLGATK